MMTSLNERILSESIGQERWIDLDAVLAELQGMAIGVWKRADASLELLQFTHDGSLSPDVASGFQQATQKVSLSQTDLGIVAAVIRGRPAPALVVPDPELPGSAGWLERFGSRMSLSWPLYDGQQQIVGVLAIAFAEPIGPTDEPWMRLENEFPVN